MPEWAPTSCAMALRDFPGLDEILEERADKPKVSPKPAWGKTKNEQLFTPTKRKKENAYCECQYYHYLSLRGQY